MPAKDVISVPFPLTWAGEAKDLSLYAGNDLQQEAINKLYNVAERVHLCSDKRLKRDWLMLQDVNYLHFMNHIDQGATNYDSAYDAFINYMNVLSDFLQLVEEQLSVGRLSVVPRFRPRRVLRYTELHAGY